MIKRLAKDVRAGSGAPLFKAILLTGVVGYTMEYTNVGSKCFIWLFGFSVYP